MINENTDHWVLEYRKNDHATNASGIDNSERFENKDTAKEAGEMLVGLSKYEWEDLQDPFEGEQLKVAGTLVRVRRGEIKIREDDDGIPRWVHGEKLTRNMTLEGNR